ncbi:SUZ domain-containing protein 1 isoform X4 [Rhineura floridana]|nr:SUZ domain-containing protein 1 isoform X4 [Rhineura floridana]
MGLRCALPCVPHPKEGLQRAGRAWAGLRKCGSEGLPHPTTPVSLCGVNRPPPSCGSLPRRTPPALTPEQEIDRRLEKKLKITQKESRKSKSPPKVPIVIQDDSLPSGPPPQIRILKRPTSNGVLSNPNAASRPAFPVKTLAQREAEYAEARKRILGSASPEEEQEKPILDR